MVAGMWNHLRSLRKMKPDDRGWIKTLLAEAENERMHLMIFIRIAKPNWFERWMIITAQFIFWHFYMFLYIFFPEQNGCILRRASLHKLYRVLERN